jgi:uncharacterized protein YcgI (DUF1989 family)
LSQVKTCAIRNGKPVVVVCGKCLDVAPEQGVQVFELVAYNALEYCMSNAAQALHSMVAQYAAPSISALVGD